MPVNRVPPPGSPATTTTASPQSEATIDVTPPKNVDAALGEKAAREAADQLLETVKRHKDLDGKTALEGYGKGDPRITERRGAVATLAADKSGRIVDEA